MINPIFMTRSRILVVLLALITLGAAFATVGCKKKDKKAEDAPKSEYVGTWRITKALMGRTKNPTINLSSVSGGQKDLKSYLDMYSKRLSGILLPGIIDRVVNNFSSLLEQTEASRFNLKDDDTFTFSNGKQTYKGKWGSDGNKVTLIFDQDSRPATTAESGYVAILNALLTDKNPELHKVNGVLELNTTLGDIAEIMARQLSMAPAGETDDAKKVREERKALAERMAAPTKLVPVYVVFEKQ